MSKIALTPNASGTGVFTIASPATNTDRTLTLPDEAGVVLTSVSSLASANLTGAVTVSGSNVGIGTTLPEAKLDVKSTLAITEASAANSNSELAFYSKFSDSQRGYVLLRCESLASGSSDLAIRTRNNFVEAERMRIDSAGRVTMPYQPACHVSCVATQTVSQSSYSPTTLDFTVQYVNVGGHFNLSTNRWTAPITGHYEFNWSYGTRSGNPSQYRSFLWKNGVQQGHTQLRNDSTGMPGYNFASRAAILYLTQNDYVELRGSIDGYTEWYSDGQLQTSMTVRLVS